MKLGITAIIRDSAPWVAEWVAFHSVVGFENFYIYLHKCKDQTQKIFEHLRKEIDIKIHVLPNDLKDPQTASYNHSYSNYGNQVDWMAFIDRDEFLFPTVETHLQPVLEKFNSMNVSGLGAYWCCFGSSGHLVEPDGMLLKNYIHRGPTELVQNRHIKSLIRGGQVGVKALGDPHFFKTPLGTIDEKSRLISKGLSDHPPSYEQLRINHYVTQSRQFFEDFKQNSFLTRNGRSEEWWATFDRNDFIDTEIQRFMQPTEKKLTLFNLSDPCHIPND